MRKLTDPLGKWLLCRLRNKEVKEDALDRLNDGKDDFKESEEFFLQFFAQRTKKWVSIAVFLLMIVSGIDFLSCGVLPNQSYGLTIDLFGAIVLGIGLLKGKYAIASESASYLNVSMPRRKALAQDSADGIWGITLIIIGILFQFVATLGFTVYTVHSCPIVLF